MLTLPKKRSRGNEDRIISEVISAPGAVEIYNNPHQVIGNFVPFSAPVANCNEDKINSCIDDVTFAWNNNTKYAKFWAQQLCVSRMCQPRYIRGGTMVDLSK